MEWTTQKAIAFAVIGAVCCFVGLILVGIVKAMFSSGSGGSSRRYRSGNDDTVEWYDKSRP